MLALILFLKRKEKRIMKGFTKFTALFLAVLMSVSVFSLTTPVSAASAYEYNVYMNAMVVSAENNSVLLDDSSTGMIAQAKAMSADAIVLNAGKYSRVSVSINNGMLEQLSNGNLPVRIILDKGKAHVNASTLKELSDKVSDKLEIEFAIGEKTVISVKADGATIELDTPITIVAESVNEGANTANVGEKPYGAAYVEGAKWGFLASADTEIELKKTQTPVFNDIVSNHWAKENIAFVTTTGYFNGVAEGKFSPNGKMTRAMVVTVLSRIDSFTGAAGAYPYKDVAANAWFAPAITWAYENGIVEAGDAFRPDDNVTRIEFMVMLYNYAKKLGIASDSEFEGSSLNFEDKDKVTDEKEIMATAFCTSNGIVTGYSTGGGKAYLRPEFTATRAEVSAMIQRFVKYAVFGGSETMQGQYTDFINLRGDLNNVYKKLTEEKELTVAYLGGSVTVGAFATSGNSWRGLTDKWLKTNFPKAKINMISAAIGSSGSHLGAFRIHADVIPQGTDLLFIEVSANDEMKGTYKKGMSDIYYESIIRQIREYLPECEIVSVYITLSDWVAKFGDKQADVPKVLEPVCEYYDVTSIDVGRALAREISATGKTAKDYISDGAHPNDAGHKVYADTIAAYLTEGLFGEMSLGYGDMQNHTYPEECMFEYNVHFAPDYVHISSPDVFDDIKGFTFYNTVCSDPNTHIPGYILPTEADNQFTFTFEGTGLDILLKFQSGGYYYSYSVDGGETQKVYLPTGQNHPFDFISGLEPGKHTVTYSYLGPSGEGETSTTRALVGFLIKGYKE